jgi:hypothetical protein
LLRIDSVLTFMAGTFAGSVVRLIKQVDSLISAHYLKAFALPWQRAASGSIILLLNTL